LKFILTYLNQSRSFFTDILLIYIYCIELRILIKTQTLMQSHITLPRTHSMRKFLDYPRSVNVGQRGNTRDGN